MVFLDQRAFAPAPAQGNLPVPGLNEILGDVESAREHLGLESMVVIGHSGNALMALEYAKRYPEHVSHVVMIGIGPNLGPLCTAAANQYWEESVDPERKELEAENLRRWPDERSDQGFIAWYVHNGPKIWFDPRFDATPLWEGVELNMAIFNRVWGIALRDLDVTKGLERLNRPVLLALGRYDFISAPPASWDPIRPKFRDLTMRVFERSGHTPPYEEPELFNRELLAWLQSRPVR
jgi:proline iminopeptidase